MKVYVLLCFYSSLPTLLLTEITVLKDYMKYVFKKIILIPQTVQHRLNYQRFHTRKVKMIKCLK